MSDALKAALKIVQEIQELRQVQSEIQSLSPQGLLGAADIPLWADADMRIQELRDELRSLR